MNKYSILFAVLLCGFISQGAETPLTADWIWRKGAELHGYNQAIVARKEVRLTKPRQAVLRITADSFYRLFINGHWVNDGPARCWPEHYQYDTIDVTPFLVEGVNEIRVVARYFGVGDFHRVPQQAGLLAQLRVLLANGKTVTFKTDSSWQVAAMPALIPNTPKVSIQKPPVEYYDARMEDCRLFQRAWVLGNANQGPWRDLTPRDVALLTKQPFSFKSFLGAKIVRSDGWNYCVPSARLAHPGLIEANHNVSRGFGMGTMLEARTNVTLRAQSEGMKMTIDGKPMDRTMHLPAGSHWILAFPSSLFGHDKEPTIRFLDPQGFTLRNPLDSASENPWGYIPLPEFTAATNDLVWMHYRREQPVGRVGDDYAKQTDEWLRVITNLASFQQHLAHRSQQLPSSSMFVHDPFWQLVDRKVVGDGTSLVSHPVGLMYDNPEVTVVHPSPTGDVELLYDLGEQNCGYYQIELEGEAGVYVDIAAVEFIAPDGSIQFPRDNRNGLRYITKAGHNQFTSLERRSGRYVFLTLRQQQSPVRIRLFQLIESTYPVNQIGSFSCSDARLDRVWDISTRTLKLCMEDTFTDCPLYEQTHWVGDARNEALFAYGVFGAHDLARRCISLSAQSLERYPLVGCQTPSSWDVLIPAWSFLWGISVGLLLGNRGCRMAAGRLSRRHPQLERGGTVCGRSWPVHRQVLEFL